MLDGRHLREVINKRKCLSVALIIIAMTAIFLRFDSKKKSKTEYPIRISMEEWLEEREKEPRNDIEFFESMESANETESEGGIDFFRLIESKNEAETTFYSEEVDTTTIMDETAYTTEQNDNELPEEKDAEIPLWLQNSSPMSRLSESTLRCTGEDMGVFTLQSTNSDHMSTDMTLKQCLNECFNRKMQYTGLTSKNECYCRGSLDGFVTYKSFKIDASADLASVQLARGTESSAHPNIRIYRTTTGCQTEFSAKYLESALIGCMPTPAILDGSMIALTLPYLDAPQCILNCEIRKYFVAVPIQKYNACICSDMYSLFKSADNMYQIMKSCPDEDEENMEKGGNLVAVYQTYAKDEYCGPRRFVRKAPATLLTSFPGSGNTWLRHLVEVATGIYTGSVYSDGALYKGGFLGEKLDPFSHRTIAIKDHLFRNGIKPEYTSAISLIRSIYNATIADFARMRTHNHVATVDPEEYRSPGFRRRALMTPSKWYNTQKYLMGNISSVLVVYYEDVMSDPVTQMRRITDFLPSSLLGNLRTRERRLMCMNLDLKGNFKRPAKHLGFDPYDAELIEQVNKKIRDLGELMKKYHQPPLPSSYLK